MANGTRFISGRVGSCHIHLSLVVIRGFFFGKTQRAEGRERQRAKGKGQGRERQNAEGRERQRARGKGQGVGEKLS